MPWGSMSTTRPAARRSMNAGQTKLRWLMVALIDPVVASNEADSRCAAEPSDGVVIRTACRPSGCGSVTGNLSSSGLAGCRPSKEMSIPPATPVVMVDSSSGGATVVGRAVRIVPSGATPAGPRMVTPSTVSSTPLTPTAAECVDGGSERNQPDRTATASHSDVTRRAFGVTVRSMAYECPHSADIREADESNSILPVQVGPLVPVCRTPSG